MPVYKVTDSKTGKTLKLTGDSPPTEQELEEIFASVPGSPQQVPPQPASVVSQLPQIAQFAMAPHAYSPSSMLQKIPELASAGAHKAGTFAAEQLARGGMNPNVAAGVGTAISMGPDLLTLQAPSPSVPKASPAAIPFARRALGFTKRFLGTPSARAKANQAAALALEKNLIPGTGNPEVAFQRAQPVLKRIGAELGQMREVAGPTKTEAVIEKLRTLKQDLAKGRTGGIWDDVNKRVDNAVESLKGLDTGSGKVTLNEITEAKNRIADSVNWLSDKASQKDTKRIVNSIERGVEKVIAEKGGDLGKYKILKKEYGGISHAVEALQNELSSQQGNVLPGVRATVGAAGQLAAGKPLSALGTLLTLEGLARAGHGIAATSINRASQLVPLLAFPASRVNSIENKLGNTKNQISNKKTNSNISNKTPINPIHPTPPDKAIESSDATNLQDVEPISKPLTKEKAYEFLKKAKGNKKKARRMAKNAGYTWEGDF